MELDGIIAISLPTWTFWMVVLLNAALVFVETWRLVLQIKERRELKRLEAMVAKQRLIERMLDQMQDEMSKPNGRRAMPPELIVQ